MSSSTADVWSAIALGARAESPLWAGALKPDGDRAEEPVFSLLGEERFALSVETIYEGYLAHFGRPRLFAPRDRDTALLLGDYLYAQGLVHLAGTGSVEAVAEMAELISLCAHLRAEGKPGDGKAWASTVAGLGDGGPKDPSAVDRALAAHSTLVG
ncbi:MAG: hypothetical protein H0V11_07660 [Actinobacteria bacterium]|nr:hypothetical protein [Actinomycetota bacterium]